MTDADRTLPPRLDGPLPGTTGHLVVRQPADEQLDLYRAAVDATYGSPFHAMSEQEARDWDELIPPRNRSVVVEQGPEGVERVLGGAGRYDTALSLPGGGRVPVAGLTAVGVAPGAQHRGAFRALIEAHLDECRARGDAASVAMGAVASRSGSHGVAPGRRAGASPPRVQTRAAPVFSRRRTQLPSRARACSKEARAAARLPSIS